MINRWRNKNRRKLENMEKAQDLAVGAVPMAQSLDDMD